MSDVLFFVFPSPESLDTATLFCVLFHDFFDFSFSRSKNKYFYVNISPLFSFFQLFLFFSSFSGICSTSSTVLPTSVQHPASPIHHKLTSPSISKRPWKPSAPVSSPPSTPNVPTPDPWMTSCKTLNRRRHQYQYQPRHQYHLSFHLRHPQNNN